jgi:predicted  nucleic acid-binding Zn-ribbon protein
MPPGISGPPRPCTFQAPPVRGFFLPGSAGAKANVLHMNADLNRLIRLQQLETATDEARRKMAEHPARIQALDARLLSARDTVAGIKARLAAAAEKRRAEEKDVASVQTRLAKYKDQLLEVKTNREYTAMLHEIETAQNDIRAREDRILEIMMESDELNAAVKKSEGELKTAEKEIAAERARLDAEVSALQTEIDKTTAEREKVVAGIDRHVLSIFETTAKGRKGVAVAEAKDGLCTICHVRLRPQVFNEVRKNESIIQCDSCRRILYFAGSTEASAPVSQV